MSFLHCSAAVGIVLMLSCVAVADEAPVRLDPNQIDLSSVTDRSELSFEESPAYYAILAHVRSVSPNKLRAEAARFLRQQWKTSPRFHQWPIEDYPLFYDLTQRPEVYRGEPVTMHGHLIRLVKYAAGPNEFGIDTLYEGWLVTPDAQTNPTTVICTEIPPGMAIGEELIDGVSATGCFFKLRTYPARDEEKHFAPMVLAHRLDWSPVDQGPAGWPATSTTLVVGLIVLIGVVGGFVLASRSNRRAKQARLRQSVPDVPPEFLNDLTP